MKKKRCIILLLFILTLNSIVFAKGEEKDEKIGKPDYYEVYENEGWELRLFYWKNSGRRIIHGKLYFEGNEMPGAENSYLDTAIGRMRYILRQEKNAGNSGWIPDGGLLLDSYKTNKKLFPTEFLKINIQNNPDLKKETEEEKHSRLLREEHEWIYGPLDRTNSGDRTNQTTSKDSDE
ncbi:MAG: hypothetical protein J6P95_04460 [Paludibacteraceae bacterium]|nr:hypothetical protein [Paludibacteraceae bacterium]